MHKPMFKILSLAGNEDLMYQQNSRTFHCPLKEQFHCPQTGNVLIFPRVSNPVWKFHGYLDFSNLISRYGFVFSVRATAGFNLILLNRLNSLSGKKLISGVEKNEVGEGTQFTGLAAIFRIKLHEISQKAWAAIYSFPVSSLSLPNTKNPSHFINKFRLLLFFPSKGS